MDQSLSSRPSGIPRLSRLPVPRAGVKPSPSRENLQASKIAVPRLRSVASRTQLSSSTTSKPRLPAASNQIYEASVIPRDRDTSTQTVLYTPQSQTPPRRASNGSLFREPSGSAAREEYQNTEIMEEDIAAEEDGARQFSKYKPRSKSRPSLSERAMETLQNIPSSPAIRKRTSSFYNSESPMRPPSRSSRPGSSYQTDTSMGPPARSMSRPASSAGSNGSVLASNSFSVESPGSTKSSNPPDFRASTNTFRPPNTPLKRPEIKSLKTPSFRGKAASSKLPSPGLSASLRQRSPSPVKNLPNIKSGSKTMSARPLKPRASLNGLFRKPSTPNLHQAGTTELDRIGFGPKKKSTTFSNTSSEGTATSKSSKATSQSSAAPTEGPDVTPRKSSMALRDQIAKAKAAKRAASAKQLSPEESPVIASGSFDFGLPEDPFNQNIGEKGAKGLLKKRIDSARSDGRLNIAAMGFKEVPEEVLKIYDLDSMNGSWAEAVDLTRFVAADNEFEILGDDVFPDIDLRAAADDEEVNGTPFGALETLDMHGNILVALPLGLRRLELLTSLNLSHNKLGNDALQVISQIRSLRELKVAGNGLTGALDPSITSLRNLELLDLKENLLTSLPESLAELVHLRVLNITENNLTSLPFDVLHRLPLMEILAAKNKLSGILISDGIGELPKLQLLDVTSNALTGISSSDSLSLPCLHQLSCTSNRITSLPNLSSWVSLLTIAAEDNSISMIPEGFVSLPKIRNVNFSGNNIKILEDDIGGMSTLDIFRISGNPLRDKKFAGMTTEDLKRALKARIEPIVTHEPKSSMDDGTFYSAPVSPISPRPSSSDWPVKAGGILDRSNTQSYSLNPVAAANVASENQIKELQLHHNTFKEIPSSIAFFAATLTSLSMAHNELTSDTFMKDDLDLPMLKELNLSSNTFNSLQPLFQRLQAPKLEKIDISFNRLSSLPSLRQYFPKLTTLLASHNTFKELSPEAIKGLRVVDCSSNEINNLNARIGLLGGPGGLERLDVSGNRFRVPKYTILEKGTEATLAWLRDRIPAGEVPAGDVSATEVE